MKPGRAGIYHIVAALLFAAWARPGMASEPRVSGIPLTDGLIMVSAYHSAEGDRENVVVVSGSAAAGVHYDWNLTQRDASGHETDAAFRRFVRAEDLAGAQRIHTVFRSQDRTGYAGYTAFSLSSAVYDSLRASGGASLGVTAVDKAGPFGASLGAAGAINGAAAGPLAGLLAKPVVLKGSLASASSTPQSFPLLVNGVRVSVPALHVKGRFAFREQRLEQDFWILDYRPHPLILKVVTGRDVFQIVRIELPLDCKQRRSCDEWIPFGQVDESAPFDERDLPTSPAGGGDSAQRDGTAQPGGRGVGGQPESNPRARPDAVGSMERTLDTRCRAELPGVFFAFGTANLNQVSHRALADVAGILSRHPQWSLSIEGHTDNIGADGANQALSEARASAVRTHLTRQLAVAPARLRASGYGESKPRESNSTIEGRARNRRVELVRPCATNPQGASP